jgi:hypothetical protein
MPSRVWDLYQDPGDELLLVDPLVLGQLRRVVGHRSKGLTGGGGQA